MSGSGRESLRMSGSGREGIPDVRELLGDPRGCPGVVGKISGMSGSVREALLHVRAWSGGTRDVREGSGGLPVVREWSGVTTVCP